MPFARFRALSSTPPRVPPGESPPKPKDVLEGKDAFKGMPSSKASLPGLVFLLSLWLLHNAYDDWTRIQEENKETIEERAARVLKVLEDEITQVMPDGTVLLKDGSIRKLP